MRSTQFLPASNPESDRSDRLRKAILSASRRRPMHGHDSAELAQIAVADLLTRDLDGKNDAWIVIRANGAVKDALRSEHRRANRETPIEKSAAFNLPAQSCTERLVASRQISRILADAMDYLPGNEARAIEMFLADKTLDQIAKRLKVTISKAHRIRDGAFEMLKAILAESRIHSVSSVF